jgi:hypothetical protein
MSVMAAWICGIRAGSAPGAPGQATHNPPVVGSSPTRPTQVTSVPPPSPSYNLSGLPINRRRCEDHLGGVTGGLPG